MKLKSLIDVPKIETTKIVNEAYASSAGIKFLVTHSIRGKSVYIDFIPATSADLTKFEVVNKDSISKDILSSLQKSMPSFSSALSPDNPRDEERLRFSINMFQLTELIAKSV
jgi:hypothetical protein